MTGFGALIDGRATDAAQRLYRVFVEGLSGRQFREWWSGSRAINGREFYEGKP